MVKFIFCTLSMVLGLALSAVNTNIEVPADSVEVSVTAPEVVESPTAVKVTVDASTVDAPVVVVEEQEQVDVPTDLGTIQVDIMESASNTWNYLNEHKVAIMVFIFGTLASLLLAIIIATIFKKSVRRIFKKNVNGVGEYFERYLSKPIGTIVFLLGMFISASGLINTLSANYVVVVARGFWAIFSLVVLWAVFSCVGVLDEFLHKISSKATNNINELMINLVRKALKVIITAIVLLFICQNILKLDVTALLASAGVVGLAVAFAAQNTIANFISSIMVILDKPFAVGDRVVINGIDGLVEEVGLRSTKIRSLDGNLYALPNSIVADNPIENITRRPSIKAVFDLTLVYSTTPEQMQQALDILHELLDKHPLFDAENPPRIFFGEFRDWALTINVICWFNTDDWWAYLDARSELNFAILKRFNAAGLSFAYPTSTTYLAGAKETPVVVNKIKHD